MEEAKKRKRWWHVGKKKQMRVEPEGVEERERGMMNVRGTGMRDGAA